MTRLTVFIVLSVRQCNSRIVGHGETGQIFPSFLFGGYPITTVIPKVEGSSSAFQLRPLWAISFDPEVSRLPSTVGGWPEP